jgi:ABC-type oligopeptide transport system substrate-binding subunit
MTRVMIAALLLTACQRDARYLGNTTPPAGQRLVFVNTNEPNTLDAALTGISCDGNMIAWLFEGLTVNDPVPKPNARALKVDQLGGVSFRYAWIDHNFKKGDLP